MSSHRDFDFLFGAWRVQHRRLKERLAHCDAWEEFSGFSTVQPLLRGFGNVDDNFIDLPGGAYRAATVRSFDSETGKWAIWWLDARQPHQIDVPIIGSFDNGIGTFLADEPFRGKPITVRFLWTAITRQSCRWEQAFSEDGARKWETNWIMDFTRMA